MPDKDIKHKRYIESINAVIYAEGKLKGTCPEIQAYLIDQTFELGGYDKDYFLNDIGIGRERSVYGIRLQDTGSGLNIERAGAHQGLSTASPPAEDWLPVHNKRKRCVVKLDGDINYFLDDDNSMWQAGKAKAQSVDNKDGVIVNVVSDDYGAGTYTIKVDGVVAEANVGKVMNIYDGVAANFWYAVIIAADELAGTYTLSHPHIEGFGAVGVGETAYYMIGNAKLNGADGNVMVYEPARYVRLKYYVDAADDPVAKIWRGWSEMLISLRPFEGAVYIAQWFSSAFEGVSANASAEAYDGWSGTLDTTPLTGYKWTSRATTTAPSKIMSVAGYYPRTNFSMTAFRTACEATGTGTYQYDFETNKQMDILMVIEYASFDTQANIAPGVTNLNSTNWDAYNGSRPMRKTGDTIQAGNKTWKMDGLNMQVNMVDANSAERKIQSFSYRGTENPYGHVVKWVDGFLFIQRNPAGKDSYCEAWAVPLDENGRADFGKYKSHADDTALYADANYIRLLGLDGELLEVINASRYWKMPSLDLLPNDDKDSSTAYCADRFYEATQSDGTSRGFAVGGYASHSSNAGAFCVGAGTGVATTYAHFGGRLCQIGK